MAMGKGLPWRSRPIVILLALSVLLVACNVQNDGGPGDGSLSSNGSSDNPPMSTIGGAAMVIEGEVVAVMESWPLQLTVQTGEDTYHVALLDETHITRRAERAEPSTLLPGALVRIEGQRSAANALVAKEIEIIDGQVP
jgi:hypothetical protein